MMSFLGFTRKSRMLEAAQAFLWSSLAIGAGICLLKKQGVKIPFCSCGADQKKEEGCGA